MFGIVHVLLPVSDRSPAEAIRASLAPFERGGRGKLPDDWLTFHDETEHVRQLYDTNWVFTDEGMGGLRIEGGEFWHLDTRAVRAEMARRGVRRWAVRFSATGPDLSVFFDQYVEGLERHPIAGSFGRWLNPRGRWDWWDLGGRFNGRITGERRRYGRAASRIASGANQGRVVLENIANALDRALGSEQPTEVDVRADDNVEIVSRLLEDVLADRDHAFPNAVLLPPGSVEDRLRWLRSWPEIEPVDTLAFLGLSSAVPWKEAVVAAYERFPDHWAAGVAYHH